MTTATDSHSLPTDSTDVRGVEEEEEGGRRDGKRSGRKSRGEDPASPFSPFLLSPPTVSPLISPSHCIYNVLSEWRFNFHYTSDMIFRLAEYVYMKRCDNIPMTTVMYCTNTHRIRMMIRTIYGKCVCGGYFNTSCPPQRIQFTFYDGPCRCLLSQSQN